MMEWLTKSLSTVLENSGRDYIWVVMFSNMCDLVITPYVYHYILYTLLVFITFTFCSVYADYVSVNA